MNRISKSINKIKSILAGFIRTMKIIRTKEHENELLKTEQLSDSYIKGSIVEYLTSKGIPSQDLTHEKLGQSKLIFTNRKVNDDKEVQAAKAEDALGASLRYLKYQRWQNKS